MSPSHSALVAKATDGTRTVSVAYPGNRAGEFAGLDGGIQPHQLISQQVHGFLDVVVVRVVDGCVLQELLM